MAWNKNVKFLLKTHTVWTSENPVIPTGAIIAVDTEDGGVRLVVGNGNNYVDTPYVGEKEDALSAILNGDGSQYVLSDGSFSDGPTLSISDITSAGYHLVTNDEWVELQKAAVATPSFVATPNFSTAVRAIGDGLSGTLSWALTKTNNSSFKDTTGGNIAVNQGSFSGLGNVDLKNLSTIAVSGANFSPSTTSSVIFTLYGVDSFDQQVSLQTFSIEFQYQIFAGTKANTTISSQTDMSNTVTKLSADGADVTLLLNPQGQSHYFHILIPTEIASALDIRNSFNPGPNSGNFNLQGTVNLTVGSLTKQYNHYVSNYQSSGEVEFKLNKAD